MQVLHNVKSRMRLRKPNEGDGPKQSDARPKSKRNPNEADLFDQEARAHQQLKRANANKLRKRNPSRINLQQPEYGGHIVEEDAAPQKHRLRRLFSFSPQSSRQNSFERGQSVEAFQVQAEHSQASPAKVNGPAAPPGYQQPQNDGSLASKLGLRVNTDSSLVDALGQSAGYCMGRKPVPTTSGLNRYGLHTHPANLGYVALHESPLESASTMFPLDLPPSAMSESPFEEARRSRYCWAEGMPEAEKRTVSDPGPSISSSPPNTAAAALMDLYRLRGGDSLQLFRTRNPDKRHFTCVGYAASKGRRCWNLIAQHNLNAAVKLLTGLSQDVIDSHELRSRLRQLAVLTLCKANHQDQVDEVVREWCPIFLDGTKRLGVMRESESSDERDGGQSALSSPFEMAHVGSSRDVHALPIAGDDWQDVDKRDLVHIAEAYGDISPCDSAVDVPGRMSLKFHGKGKGRVIDVDSSLATLQEPSRAGSQSNQEGLRRVLALVQLHIEREEEEQGTAAQPERHAIDAGGHLADEADAERVTSWPETKRLKEPDARALLHLKQEEEQGVEAQRAQLRLCSACGESKYPFEFREQVPASSCERTEAICNRCQEHVERLQQEYEEEQAAERARIARLRECSVCGDSKDPLEYPAKAPTATCEHPAQTCNECLESWLAAQYDSNGTDGIKCPECAESLEYADVQRAASKETFEAYDKVMTRNALSSLPEFAWCLGQGCGSGQLNEENENFMDCANCGYKQCLQHKTPWHTDETCAQYDYRVSGQKAKDEERAAEAMLNALSKKCPGATCGWRIEKIDGCDHMTCKKCKWEFCWLCLASFKEIKKHGNTAHETGCKYHTDSLNLQWPFNVH